MHPFRCFWKTPPPPSIMNAVCNAMFPEHINVHFLSNCHNFIILHVFFFEQQCLAPQLMSVPKSCILYPDWHTCALHPRPLQERQSHSAPCIAETDISIMLYALEFFSRI